MAETKRITILSIDDNLNNLFTLKTLLENHLPVFVINASSGENALKMLLAENIDLIILDVNMPGLNGFQTAEYIKKREKTKDIPIIFLTAEYKTLEASEKGFQLGAIDYLTKPINEYKLINKINLYIKVISMTKELKRSNEELSSFASVISHDLKEPLRTVHNFVNLLDKQYSGDLDDKGKEFIGIIKKGAERMRLMIDNLLDYSRLKNTENNLSLIDLNEIIEEVKENLKTTIDKHETIITCDTLPQIYSNEGLIIRLFQNLIGNSIKFYRTKPIRIHIRAQKKEHEYIFSVEDNGRGIKAAYIPFLFKIFKRFHAQEEDSGLGMGLAICKKIVESWGGNIWVESEPDQGSTFYFSLPINRE